MLIEEFFQKSIGEWNSMRSSHSLAFQEFEEIRSRIKITIAKNNDSRIRNFFNANLISFDKVKNAYLISWEAKSEWDDEYLKENTSGESIVIPLETSKNEGKIIRSQGYSEAVQLISSYKILNDGTLIIHSNYSSIYTEERIWFVSNNVRSRSSVTKSLNSLAILQTSYASEIRLVKI